MTYDLASPIYIVLAVGYAIIALILNPSERRDDLLKATIEVIVAPDFLRSRFPNDQYSLNSLYDFFREDVRKILDGPRKKLGNAWNDIVSSQGKYLIGGFILLVAISAFFLSDLIALEQLLAQNNIGFSEILPQWLQPLLANYGIAVSIAIFGTVLVSGFISEELKKSNYVDTDMMDDTFKTSHQILASVLTWVSIGVGVLLGLDALILLGDVPSWMEQIINAVNDFNIAVTTRFILLTTTYLIFRLALGGLHSLWLGIIGVLYLVYFVLWLFGTAICLAFPLVIDTIVRLGIWLVLLVTAMFYGPIEGIIEFIMKIIRLFRS